MSSQSVEGHCKQCCYGEISVEVVREVVNGIERPKAYFYCSRCGYQYSCRLFLNKDGSIKHMKKGELKSQFREQKGYGAMSLRPAEFRGWYPVCCFGKPVSKIFIEKAKKKIARNNHGYLNIWNEKTKNIDEIVGDFSTFWQRETLELESD